MNITLNTYLLNIKKNIHYAIIVIIIATIIHFVLNYFSEKKISYKFEMNLYKLVALQNVNSDSSITFPISSQLQNLAYKVQTDAKNSKVSELEGIKCSFESNLFSCFNEDVIKSKSKKYDIFIKKFEEIIRNRFSILFEEELSLIDDKVNSIRNLFEEINEVDKKKNQDIEKLISVLDTNDIEMKSLELFRILKDQQFFDAALDEHRYSRLEPLLFLKSSLSKYSSQLNSTPIEIEITQQGKNTNYLLTALIALMGYFLIIFISLKEKE